MFLCPRKRSFEKIAEKYHQEWQKCSSPNTETFKKQKILVISKDAALENKK